METSYYEPFRTKSDPAGTPAWLSLVTTLLETGMPVATAVIQANNQTGQNINPNQVPSYLLQQMPQQYQQQFPQYFPQPAPQTKDSKVLGMDPTAGVLVIVGVLLAIGFGAFYFIKKR